MYVLEVGKKFPFNMSEGMLIDLKDNGFEFLLSGTHWSKEEIGSFSKGEVSLELVYIDNIIFFLIEIEGLLDFCDAPFHIKLSDTEIWDIPEGKGYGFYMYLIDSIDNTIKGMRLISFSHNFSRTLKKIIDIQKKKPFEIAIFDYNLDKVYKYYSTKRLRSLNCAFFSTGQ